MFVCMFVLPFVLDSCQVKPCNHPQTLGIFLKVTRKNIQSSCKENIESSEKKEDKKQDAHEITEQYILF